MSDIIKGEQSGITENLKKGITEMLILAFLDKQDMHIYAIINKLDDCSNGNSTIFRKPECRLNH